MDKLERLKEELRGLGRVAVAYSSGVDSTFLLKVTHDVLGENAVALTACAENFPARERTEAEEFCRREGIRQLCIDFRPMEVEGFRKNPKNRCYYCKKALFQRFLTVAEELGCAAVVEGSNVDDDGDYRPGHLAIRELGVVSPLRAAGLTKAEIRALSREMNLTTWDKPSFACLASRFVYGEEITGEKLAMVEKAEELLRSMGFSQFRVRLHGTLGRIELLPSEIGRMMEPECRAEVNQRLRGWGFSYIALDLAGYRTGSMNETIDRNL